MRASQRDDDFAQRFEADFARLRFRIEKACVAEAGWPEQVAAGTRAAFTFAVANPEAVTRLMTGSLAHGVDGFLLYERLIAYLARSLEPGRKQRPENTWLPEITERSAAGGVAILVAHRLDMGREDELLVLAPEAIEFMLTPYLGPDEAHRVAAQNPRR